LAAEASSQAAGTAAAAAEMAGAEMAGAGAGATAPAAAQTNLASAEGWEVLEAILQSGPAASILSRLMCGALGKARAVAAGSEMTAAVADDTHQFMPVLSQM
jgi:hypothetical protein